MPENDWNTKASGILKSIIARRNITYHELSLKLNAIGVKETQSSISNKISRGTFGFAFLLQCMEALNINEIRIN